MPKTSRPAHLLLGVSLVGLLGVTSYANADDVFAWGRNNNGKLGDGTTVDRLSPTPVISLPGSIIGVEASAFASFAWDADGVGYAWGGNVQKELADGSGPFEFDFAAHPTPMPIAALSGDTVTSIGAGSNAIFALSDGAVLGWGNNGSNRLGFASSSSSVSTPTAAPTLASGVTKVDAAANTSFAIQNGALYAFGGNNVGEAGTGDRNAVTTPTVVPTMGSGVTDVAPGSAHALGIRDGAVYSWGSSSNGQLGRGVTGDFQTAYAPEIVPGLGSGATQIAGGSLHSLALVNGDVYAWGFNSSGQLGNGTTTTSATPILVSGIEGTIIDVVAGDSSSFALTSEGNLWVWGGNTSGELGLGSTATSVLVPTLLEAPEGYAFTSLSTGLGSNGGSHVLATAAAVPEPASAGVLVLATSLLGLRRRRA